MNNPRLRRLLVLPALIAVMMTGCTKDIYQKPHKPEVILSAGSSDLSLRRIHFSADTVYVLTTSLTIDSGRRLEIEPGTLIKVNDRVSVNILRGALIEAAGTATDPIVFTSSASKGGVGVGSGSVGGEHYWYGIRIYGNDAGTGETSGKMGFVRIEFAGGNEGSMGLEEAVPALLLEHVSASTAIHDIQVSYSFEVPSFGFSGGTVNARDLVSYAAVGIDFYLRHGYRGKMQNILAYRHPYFAATAGVRGSLSGLLMEDSVTEPVISNLSILGPGPQISAAPAYARQPDDFNSYRVAGIIASTGTKFHLSNAVVLGFPHACWWLDDKNTALSLAGGSSTATHSYYQCDDTSHPFYLDPNVYPPFDANDFKAAMEQAGKDNVFVQSYAAAGLDAAANYDSNPEPVPAAGSPLLDGAVFDGPYTDAFFEHVDYKGAVGLQSWLQGWTNFVPLQTSYNR